MKKHLFSLIIFVTLITGAAFAQNSDPVYVNGLFLSNCFAEFAVNGPDKDSIKYIEPYVKNGRVYFYTTAFPLSSGNLTPGFEFNLDVQNRDNPRIKAVYRGNQNDEIPASYKSRDMVVIGYAERGSIIVTRVFLKFSEAQEWEKSANTAFDYD